MIDVVRFLTTSYISGYELCTFLKMGFIKDWGNLKEIIGKLD